MQTENLNEMIQNNAGSPIEFNEPDFIYTLPRKKLTYSDVKNDVLNVEKPATESTITQVEVIPESSTTEFNTNHYHPESEQALIDYVNGQNSKLEMATILVKWEIGRCINSFYQGKYGTNELGKISEATGIGINSLQKMCRFARIYTTEQLQSLLKGNYTLTWFDIAQNLTVEPARVIQTFELSENYDDFLIQIKRLKDPDEKRGKAKIINSVEVNAMNVEKPEQLNVAPTEITVAVILEKAAPKIMPEESVVAECSEPYKTVDSIEPSKYNEANESELNLLWRDNIRLRKEISSRDLKVRELEKVLSDVKREKEKFENSYYAYMHKLDKVRSALENNTPARAILEWMDQGDDE